MSTVELITNEFVQWITFELNQKEGKMEKKYLIKYNEITFTINDLKSLLIIINYYLSLLIIIYHY